MKSYIAKKNQVDRKWWVVDLDGKTLGRIASPIAAVLRGKHKPEYTPHVDTGDFVVVVNAGRFHLTGRKWDQKLYQHYSGYPGGLKTTTARKMAATRPEEPIRLAVRGMLPKGALGRQMIRKLKVYPGPDHPHQAQDPAPLSF